MRPVEPGARRPGGRTVALGLAAAVALLALVVVVAAARGFGVTRIRSIVVDAPSRPASLRSLPYSERVRAAPSGIRGADAELDALLDDCVGDDPAACDRLKEQATLDSPYEALATTCNGRLPEGLPLDCTEAMGVTRPDTIPEGAAWGYGSDPALDALWDACRGNDFAGCDRLYDRAPDGSPYKALAGSCNGLLPVGSDAYCGGTFADGGGVLVVLELRRAWARLYATACAYGDFAACDDLQWTTRPMARYRVFAATCGSRTDPVLPGDCVADLGPGTRYPGLVGSDPALDRMAAACRAGDLAACDTLYAAAGADTEYRMVATTCGGRAFVPARGSCSVE